MALEDTTATAKVVFRRFVAAILETVNESPEGAPAGILLLAVQEVFPSVTAGTFALLLDQMVRLKMMERRGDVLFPLKKPEV